MAKFLTPLIAELHRNEVTWSLSAPLLYESDRGINGKYIIAVPKGFVTDLASVPRLPLAYLVAGGMADKAAVVHDFLYENAIGTKEQADLIFLEAMKASGVSAWRRRLMYWAVCLGGKGKFKEN